MNGVLRSRPVCLLLICLFFAAAASAQKVSCTVQQAPTDPASQAFAHQDYTKAVELYAAQAKSDPKDLEAIAGQVRSLIGADRVDEAATLAENSFSAHPKSAALAAVVGEVRYRQGRLADAVNAYNTALQLDPCLARTRYDFYRIMRVESMDASAYTQLRMAHALEPNDPDIHIAWVETLPLAERAAQIDSYLSTAKEMPADRQNALKEYAGRLRAILANGHGGCRLASASATTTKLPFEYLQKDEANRYHSIGFDVKVNNKANARLELDTGASGILLDSGTAKRAGLVSVTGDTITGLGDEKNMGGFWAYADDLRVGTLEFKNCMVEVSDKHSILGIDGLIGANAFENYHVQLDFPLRQMTLSPLPTRPGEAATHGAALNASGVGGAAAASATSTGKTAVTLLVVHYMDRYVSPEMKSWSPFARVGHQILINGQLKDRQPRLFLLDSGSENSFLSIPAGRSIGKLHTDSEDQINGLSGRVKKIYTVTNADLIFAGLRSPYQDIMVMSLDGLSRNNGIEVSGIIGLDTMLVLTVDIDYRDGLIQLHYDPKHGLNVGQGFH